MKKILVVDDNITICLMLRSWLLKNNYEVDTANSVSEAIEKIRHEAFDLILSDIIMPEDDGFSLLAWVQKYDSDILVMMMTSYADIESAVESIKQGAVDYIAKPIDADVLFQKIEDAFRKSEIAMQTKGLQQYIINTKFVGSDDIHNQLVDVIRSNSHLLILGQAGTGKSTAAKFVYLKGVQELGVYVEFDLNFLADYRAKTDLDDEGLFAYYFEKAKGGLLHIKNFKKIDIKFQTSLIHALTRQSKNEHFAQIVITSRYSKEKIREDFIPKLSEKLLESYVELPSIGGREEDILSYSKFFLEMANKELDKNISMIDSEVYNVLFEQKWEGNIQELKNIVFKMVLLSDKDVISKNMIPYILNKNNLVIEANTSLSNKPLDRLKKENFERKKITEALDIAKGNKTLAATLLNIDRKTLYNKIRLYEIS